MSVLRGLFVRKDSTRGTTPVEARVALAGLLTQNGDLGVTPGVLSGGAVSGKTSWAYSVGAGHYVTTRSATDGAVLLATDGPTDTPTVAAAPVTGSRWDLIWIRHRDIENADPDSNAVLGVTQGTASGSPSKPYGSVPTGALVLAEAQVSAGAANTADALVTITGVAARVAARGGIASATTAGQRAALASAGTTTSPVYVELGGVLYKGDGSGWVALSGLGDPTSLSPQDPGGFASLGRPVRMHKAADGTVDVFGTFLYRPSGTTPVTAGSALAIWAAGSIPAAFRPGSVVAEPALIRLSTAAPAAAEVRINVDGSVQVVSTASGTIGASSTTSGITFPSFRFRAGE